MGNWMVGQIPFDTGRTPIMPGTPGVSAADFTVGSSQVAPLPSVVAAGDLLLLGVWGDVAPGTAIATPSGWTRVHDSTKMAFFSKVAGASETAPTLTWSTNPGDRVTIMRGYRGHASTPHIASSAIVADSVNNVLNMPQLTVSGNNLMVYFAGYYEAFVTGSVYFDVLGSSTIGNIAGDGEVVVIATSGDEDIGAYSGTSPAHTASGAGGTHDWNAVTVAIPYA